MSSLLLFEKLKAVESGSYREHHVSGRRSSSFLRGFWHKLLFSKNLLVFQTISNSMLELFNIALRFERIVFPEKLD